MHQPIPENVRRFVLTSVPSVPHLETLLLLWRDPGYDWTAEQIGSRLYVPPDAARSIAQDLAHAGLLQATDDPDTFRSRADDPGLTTLLEEVEITYSRHLRAVSELIHSNLDRKAATFAQAFSWRKK